MSHIIEEVSKMDGPTILMVDEVLPYADKKKSGETVIYDWSSLKLSSEVDVIIALSPAPNDNGDQFQVIPPSHPLIYTQQLLHKFRCFAELDRLLSCMKSHSLSNGE